MASSNSYNSNRMPHFFVVHEFGPFVTFVLQKQNVNFESYYHINGAIRLQMRLRQSHLSKFPTRRTYIRAPHEDAIAQQVQTESVFVVRTSQSKTEWNTAHTHIVRSFVVVVVVVVTKHSKHIFPIVWRQLYVYTYLYAVLVDRQTFVSAVERRNE